MTFEVRAFEARTVTWWYRLQDEIDFNPAYQRRGIVWGTDRQAFLIDSIINDFDVPKLYLADFTYFHSSLNSSRRRFAVIDGKQRLTAIFSFLDDAFPLAPDFVLRDDPELLLAGYTYSELRQLSPHVAAKVENFNLPVMSVITDEERTVQELFVRLNSGKPLTSAERRSALGGVVPSLVQEILTSPFFEYCVAFTPRAGAHEQAAAKLLLLELVGAPVTLKRRQLDELYARGEVEYEKDAIRRAAVDVLETLSRMSNYFQQHDPLLRSQGQLPVMYLLFRSGDPAPEVRERLVLFQELRRSLRTGFHQRLQPPWLAQALLQYEQAARSPNDASSIWEMHGLLRWFVDVHALEWSRWDRPTDENPSAESGVRRDH